MSLLLTRSSNEENAVSHVDSVAPPTTQTVAPGGTVDFDVTVSGVPADDTHNAQFVGSDGVPFTVQVTVDRPQLGGILTGTPLNHQVKGTATAGVLAVLSVTGSVVKFRYTAP